MDKEKRLNIKLTDELASLPAFGRFYTKYSGTASYATKRSQINNILQSGALIVEAELQGVFSFLDAGAFAAASVTDKQRMILDALAMRIGHVSPTPPATKAEIPPAVEISEPEPTETAIIEPMVEQEPEVIATSEPEPEMDDAAKAAMKERFKAFRPG